MIDLFFPYENLPFCFAILNLFDYFHNTNHSLFSHYDFSIEKTIASLIYVSRKEKQDTLLPLWKILILKNTVKIAKTDVKRKKEIIQAPKTPQEQISHHMPQEIMDIVKSYIHNYMSIHHQNVCFS